MKDRVDHLPENYGKSQWTDNRLLIFASYKNKLLRKLQLNQKSFKEIIFNAIKQKESNYSKI